MTVTELEPTAHQRTQTPADRRNAIIQLLQTRDDHLPTTRPRDTGTTSGFTHHAIVRETCPDCLANDKRMPGCETCRGRGYTETIRERDPYAVDKVQPYGLAPDRHESRRQRDLEIQRLTNQTQPPKSETDLIAEANKHPDRWEIERRRMYLNHDYHALDLALDSLRIHNEPGYHVIHSVYVYRAWSELSTTVEILLHHALEFIDQRMPDPIRAPGHPHPALIRRQSIRSPRQDSDTALGRGPSNARTGSGHGVGGTVSADGP